MQTKQNIKQTIKTLKSLLKVSACPKTKKELTNVLQDKKVSYILTAEEYKALNVTIDLLSDCI